MEIHRRISSWMQAGIPITVKVGMNGFTQRTLRTVKFLNPAKLAKIFASVVLVIFTLGTFATILPLKDAVQPISVSYNPYPADQYHSPLSGIGLIMAVNGTLSFLRSETIAGSQPVRSGGQSIRQNGLRFIIDDSYFPQSETSIAIDPKNTSHVLGAFNDPKYFFCGVLPADCGGSIPVSLSGFSVSLDGGKSVAKTGDLPQLVVGLFLLTPFGDPSIAPTTDGNFFYSTLGFDERTGRNGIIVAKSNANLFDPTVSCVSSPSNRTFNPCWTEKFVHGNAVNFSFGLEDKDLLAVDRNSTSPYFGSVYVGWDHFFTRDGSASYLARCDGNITSCVMLSGFNRPVISGNDPFASFTMPVVGKDGSVYVTWCNYGTSFTFGPIVCSIRSSPPGGSNFGPLSTILSFMGAGTMLPNATYIIGWATEQFRTASVPNLAIDLSGKSQNLYFTIGVCISGFYDAFSHFDNPFVAYDNPGNCGASAILFSRSSDGGSNWTSPVNLSQRVVNDQPYVTVDSVTGNVYVLYYTSQYDSFNHRLDVVASKSIDGGVRWRQARVTSVSNEPNSDPNMYTYYSSTGGALTVPEYGDYFQAVAIGGTLSVLFTANYAVEAGTFQTDPFLIIANI